MSPESSAPLMVAPFRTRLAARAGASGAARPVSTVVTRCTRTAAAGRRAGSCSLVALLVLLAAAAVFVGVRLTTPDPPPVVTPVVHRTVTVPAQSVSLPWPTTGQAAIAVPSIGIDVASGPEQSGAGRQPDQADDGLRDPARPPAGG